MRLEEGLERFVEAQRPEYARALDEIRRGAKRGHWMWFVFPQLRGLGRSAMAEHFAISSRAEARAYLDHAILGPRYIASVETLQDLGCSDPVSVFGETDARKLRSSLTLFEAASGRPLLAAADRWFGGMRDVKTLALLSADESGAEAR